MVKFAFKNKTLLYEGEEDFEQQIAEYARSLGASTDGEALQLRKREHIALVEQYAENLKKKSSRK